MSRIRMMISQPLSLLYMLPAIVLGLTLHEWGHAHAAYELGDPTARNLGRLSLNPIDHIDPIGLLCMFLLGFGWAKPVPVNPRNFSKPRRDELIVSLAGIAMNILITVVFGIVTVLILRAKPALIRNRAFYSIFMNIVTLNVTLAVFNLVPVPPLDGSHVFECLFGRHLSYNVRVFMAKYGRFILLALLYLGVLDYPISWAQSLVIKGMNLLLRL